MLRQFKNISLKHFLYFYLKVINKRCKFYHVIVILSIWKKTMFHFCFTRKIHIKMGKDVDRGDFYNTYNFMRITSFMGLIGYTDYPWGGERGREGGTAYILPKIHNINIMFCCPNGTYIHERFIKEPVQSIYLFSLKCS